MINNNYKTQVFEIGKELSHDERHAIYCNIFKSNYQRPRSQTNSVSLGTKSII